MDHIPVADAIQKIKGRKHQGSSLADSLLYHDLPFDGLTHYQSHRRNTIDRWNLIKSSGVSFEGKNVIDIGCNVGAFSLLAAKDNAFIVCGYDYDKQSLEVGRNAADYLGLKNVDFEETDINLDFIKSFNNIDITIWLSQWMWVVKQHGIETAKEMLFEMSKNSKIMIFESAANDAMAAIKNTTQKTILEWLWENTIYSEIKDLGFVPGWNERHVYVCESPVRRWRGFTSFVHRIDRKTVRKVYHKGYEWMLEREIKCLCRMSEYNCTPVVTKKGSNWYEMNYCGGQQDLKLHVTDPGKILEALRQCRIVHRDINPRNLMVMNGKICLIDFGWALMDDERDTPQPAPSILGGRYYRENRWDDEAAMKMSIGKG